MYAVFEFDGRQFKVAEGEIVKVSRIGKNIDDTVIFDKVLLIGDNDKIHLGQPYIGKAEIEGKVLEHAKDNKKLIVKYKKRKDYRRKIGHRQPITNIRIEKIRIS
ncbi:MAG: 50S ribosomal protein L21 [Candidatus Coatesbacteria bacterium]|nr:50S ribosomal protein L21 [Candidatus Coatesbacteria bacterium]